MQAFLQLEDKIRNQLKDYEIIIGSRQLLEKPEFDKFCLFGKIINIEMTSEGFTIKDELFEELLNDCKRQFEPYQQIFELRNKMIELNDKYEPIKKLLEYKKQIIFQGPPGTGKTYTAKDIAYEIIFDRQVSGEPMERKKQMEELQNSDQFKLIQFHPAYSYEDFVRGISARENNGSIEYNTEDRVLVKFAQDAIKEKVIYSYDDYDKFFPSFLKMIKENIPYELNNSKYTIKGVGSNFFDVHDNGKHFRKVRFEAIKSTYRELISCQPPLGGGYYMEEDCSKKFMFFLNNSTEIDYEKKKQKYVLVIDEINRANLPSVLGELIYALEYRGEFVESMYEKDGVRNIVLPPNLYIIGTMNTADRSVGHIDYAIRRRFSFVDILPELSIIQTCGCEKAEELFKEVAKLFVKDNGRPADTLSPEFQADNVMLGHSYFMEQDEENLKVRLVYEIIPLLMEYVKDGILINDAETKIQALSV
ncbi:ATPase [Marinilabilia rubra]|uniref:ATPase n=2 Tax=Marinilabilia rubra TaxID=2162893 RepID=A0A2U2BAX6_9BACT|nr:ATPase [Marinilabilia rubra]